MNEFLGKISSYNLFNYLFSGVLFVVLCTTFTNYSFIQQDLIMGVFLYYFIGLVVSRVGSLFIEPLLKLISFVKFEKYSDYVTALKKDPSLDVLSEVNNMYRTLVSVFVCLLFLKLFELVKFRFMSIWSYESYIILGLLLAMFLFAYRKQTSYISKRVKTNIQNHE